MPGTPDLERRLAVGAILTAACCWGALGVSYALILDRHRIDPLAVLAIRTTTAALILFLWIMWRPKLRASVRQLWSRALVGPVLLSGSISTAVFYVALIFAFQEAGVAITTVLLYLAPSIVAVGSWVFQGIATPRGQQWALVVAFIGVIGVSGALETDPRASGLGVALGVFSAATYASYSVIGVSVIRVVPPLVAVFGSMVVAATLLSTARLIVGGAAPPALSAAALVATVNGVGTTLVPLTLYTWGLSRLGAGKASLLAIAEPMVAVFLAYIVLGERLSPLQFAGALAIGVSLVAATGTGSKR